MSSEKAEQARSERPLCRDRPQRNATEITPEKVNSQVAGTVTHILGRKVSTWSQAETNLIAVAQDLKRAL